MALTKIPTRTDDSLGRVKYDQRPATDLETQIQASEYNATADAVIAVSEAVGLADGSTPGSLEARLADALSRLDDAETCCATNGDRLDLIEPEVANHEQRIATLEQGAGDAVDQQARDRLDVVEPKVTALEEVEGRRAWGSFVADDTDAVLVKGRGLESAAPDEGGAWAVTLLGAPDVTEATVQVTTSDDNGIGTIPTILEKTSGGKIFVAFRDLGTGAFVDKPPPFSIMVQL